MHEDTVALVASKIAQAQLNGQFALADLWWGFVADWYDQATLTRVAVVVNGLND